MPDEGRQMSRRWFLAAAVVLIVVLVVGYYWVPTWFGPEVYIFPAY
jgi:cytochrome c-type biogenesis protein CcmH/NrfG